MAISTMYTAMPGSPETALAVDITADATSMTVADGNALPAAPNIAVIGDESNAEVVIYNQKSGNTLSGLIRGLGGTTASAWTTGTSVARNYTSFDHNRFKENIEDLATNKADVADVYTQTEIDTLLNAKQNTLTFDNSPTANSSNPVKSSGIKTALDGKQNTLTFDNSPTANSANPVTSGGVKSALDTKVSKSGDTMTGTLVISGDGKTLRFVPTDTSKISLAQIAVRNNERFAFWQRTPAETGNELYLLPAINTSATGNLYYDILTSKTPVTLAQGGTGGTDSGWQSYTDSNVFTGTIYYRKVGAFFMIGGQAIKLANALTAGNSLLLMTLSSAYRPAKEIMPSCFMNTGAVNNRIAPMRLTTSGGLYLYANKTDDIATTYILYFSGFGFM